jgi:hypothetical protein
VWLSSQRNACTSGRHRFDESRQTCLPAEGPQWEACELCCTTFNQSARNQGTQIRVHFFFFRSNQSARNQSARIRVHESEYTFFFFAHRPQSRRASSHRGVRRRTDLGLTVALEGLVCGLAVSIHRSPANPPVRWRGGAIEYRDQLT